MKRRTSSLLVASVLAVSLPAVGWADSLQEVIKQTVSSNPDVLETVYTRMAVDQEIRQAKAGYYPSIDFNAGIGPESTDSPLTRSAGYSSRDLTRRELGLTLRQPLYTGGATTHEVGRQQERTNSRAYALHAMAEQVGLRTAEVYLDVLKRQELVKLAQEQHQIHEKNYEQVSSRSLAGVGRGADLDQSRSRLLLAKSNLMAEESNLREAEINYFRVVNKAPDNLVLPTPALNAVPPTVADAVKQAVEGHPTLKSAAADIEAAKEQYASAKSPYFPRLDFELGANRNNNISGLAGENNNLSAMLRMRYNLFAGGRDVARRAQTLNQIDEARQIRNHTCRQVVESMRLSWNSLKTFDAQLVYLKQRVEAAQSARDNYRNQFMLGQRSLLDLLDSENEVFVAKKAMVIAEYDRSFAAYRVAAGEGKLLQAVEVGLPPEAQPVSQNLSEATCPPDVPAQAVPEAIPLAPAPKVTALAPPPPAPPKPMIVERLVPSAPVVVEKIKEVPSKPVVLERITLQAGAMFDTNKADLKPAGKAELDELVVKLNKVKRLEQLEIVGHTDSQGSAVLNQRLSVARAQSVADYLVTRGVSRDMIVARGMGKDLPVATNATAAGRAKNRRVEVNIRVTRQTEE